MIEWPAWLRMFRWQPCDNFAHLQQCSCWGNERVEVWRGGSAVWYSLPVSSALLETDTSVRRAAVPSNVGLNIQGDHTATCYHEQVHLSCVLATWFIDDNLNWKLIYNQEFLNFATFDKRLASTKVQRKEMMMEMGRNFKFEICSFIHSDVRS